jgi:hypothetical protein
MLKWNRRKLMKSKDLKDKEIKLEVGFTVDKAWLTLRYQERRNQ